VLHLVNEFLAREHVGEAHRGGAVEQRERDVGGRVVLPDELEHQQLVEIGIEQGARDGVEFQLWLCARSAKLTIIRVASRGGFSRTILCERPEKSNRSYRKDAFLAVGLT